MELHWLLLKEFNNWVREEIREICCIKEKPEDKPQHHYLKIVDSKRVEEAIERVAPYFAFDKKGLILPEYDDDAVESPGLKEDIKIARLHEELLSKEIQRLDEMDRRSGRVRRGKSEPEQLTLPLEG